MGEPMRAPDRASNWRGRSGLPRSPRINGARPAGLLKPTVLLVHLMTSSRSSLLELCRAKQLKSHYLLCHWRGWRCKWRPPDVWGSASTFGLFNCRIDSRDNESMLLAEVSMKSKAVRSLATTIALLVVVLSSSPVQSIQSGSQTSAKPLLLGRNEGELRTRRIHADASVPASSQFMLKVSPKNNGSQHLVAGTEELAPGAAIPKHRHLAQDEIVLIHSGKARVWLGDQERDLHAGGLVFIPENTWVSLKNVGTDPISLTFIFSAPGFEDTMRCNSVPAGEKPTQITPEQQKECAHLGHAESAGRAEQPGK